MIEQESMNSPAEPTVAELEALLAAPPKPVVRPLPTVQPRAKKARTGQAVEDGHYYDVNDGIIKEEPKPQAPALPIPVVQPAPVVRSYSAPVRDWD
jgi:hypothetical protein